MDVGCKDEECNDELLNDWMDYLKMNGLKVGWIIYWMDKCNKEEVDDCIDERMNCCRM